MKKTVLVLLSVLTLGMSVFADETKDQNEKRVSPYFSVENDSEFYVSEDPSDDAPLFNGYNNNASVDIGISFKISNIISLPIFVGTRDLNWDVDNLGNFKFASVEVYAGFGLDITPADFIEINLKLSNYEKFESSMKINFGFDFETGFAFNFEKAFISFNICNNFNPCFTAKEAFINDSIEYDFTFNFFNFINDKINTGLYFEGTIESTNTLDDSGNTPYEISNEFFVGIMTSPVEFLTAYALFAMFNEAKYEKNEAVTGSKINSFGLKIGAAFTYEWFSAELFYQPKIGVFVDDIDSKNSEHTIGFSFGIEL